MSITQSAGIVFVAGGASGIGEAAVREFINRSYSVVLFDRDATGCERVCRDCPEVVGITGDASVINDVEAAISTTLSKFGRIDVLVNSAGIQRYGTATTTDEIIWDEVMSINLKSAFLLAKFAIRAMQKQKAGVVINVGSAQSLGAIQNSAAYVSSKHALLGLTRCIAIDFAGDGIRAHCVCPGAIDTPMLRHSASLSSHPDAVIRACEQVHLLNRLGQPEEVARVICFLASADASFMTGHAVLVDGGALVPIGGRSFQEEGTGTGT